MLKTGIVDIRARLELPGNGAGKKNPTAYAARVQGDEGSCSLNIVSTRMPSLTPFVTRKSEVKSLQSAVSQLCRELCRAQGLDTPVAQNHIPF